MKLRLFSILLFVASTVKAQETGNLIIRTTPADAEVYLNNERIDAADTIRLSPGRYELRRSALNYYTKTDTVSITPGCNQKYAHTLIQSQEYLDSCNLYYNKRKHREKLFEYATDVLFISAGTSTLHVTPSILNGVLILNELGNSVSDETYYHSNPTAEDELFLLKKINH